MTLVFRLRSRVGVLCIERIQTTSGWHFCWYFDQVSQNLALPIFILCWVTTFYMTLSTFVRDTPIVHNLHCYQTKSITIRFLNFERQKIKPLWRLTDCGTRMNRESIPVGCAPPASPTVCVVGRPPLGVSTGRGGGGYVLKWTSLKRSPVMTTSMSIVGEWVSQRPAAFDNTHLLVHKHFQISIHKWISGNHSSTKTCQIFGLWTKCAVLGLLFALHLLTWYAERCG